MGKDPSRGGRRTQPAKGKSEHLIRPGAGLNSLGKGSEAWWQKYDPVPRVGQMNTQHFIKPQSTAC